MSAPAHAPPARAERGPEPEATVSVESSQNDATQPALNAAQMQRQLQAPPSRGPRIALVAFAVVALLLVAQRNGWLYSIADGLGMKDTYVGIEASLGGPGFGTPRAVEDLLSRVTIDASPVAVPASVEEHMKSAKGD